MKRTPLPLPKIGAKFRKRNGLGFTTYHVRGFVDDHVILRHWSPRRQCWNYTAEPDFVFILPGFGLFEPVTRARGKR